MSQLDTIHRSAEIIHKEIEKITSDMAKLQSIAKEAGTNTRNYQYSDEYRLHESKIRKLRLELQYVREKEFIESLQTGDKVTVLGNPRNGYRPTRLLAELNESMRMDGGGAMDIVELEITSRDTTENNSGVLGKNVHGKKLMKGVLIPRPQFVNQNADPVYFYWINQK